MTLSEPQSAYLAGLIDGEGHIGADRLKVTSRSRSINVSYSAVLDIRMATSEPLATVGAWLDAPPRRVWMRQPDRYAWLIRMKGPRLRPVLVAVRPYLILKPDQATFALRMIQLRQLYAHGRSLPRTVLAEMENLYLALKEAHKRDQYSGAAAAWAANKNKKPERGQVALLEVEDEEV